MEFKGYKRKLILLNSRTAMLIHLMEKCDDDLELMDIYEMVEPGKMDTTEIYKEAADQLFKQFEENECMLFIKCLRAKCEEYINNQNKLKFKKK